MPQTCEIYFLTVLEIGSLRSRRQQGIFLGQLSPWVISGWRDTRERKREKMWGMPSSLLLPIMRVPPSWPNIKCLPRALLYMPSHWRLKQSSTCEFGGQGNVNIQSVTPTISLVVWSYKKLLIYKQWQESPFIKHRQEAPASRGSTRAISVGTAPGRAVCTDPKRNPRVG